MGDARRSRMIPLNPGYEGGPNVLQLRHDHQEQQQAASSKGDDVQVVASMARRLSSLERELKEKSSLVHRLQQENDKLKAKAKAADDSHHLHHHDLSHSHHSRESTHPSSQPATPAQPSASTSACELPQPPSPSSDVVHKLQAETEHLRSETCRLRKQLRQAWGQVASMKQFLEDYGMVWVGEQEGQQGGGGGGKQGVHTLAETGAGPALRPGSSHAVATTAPARSNGHALASTSAAEPLPSKHRMTGPPSPSGKTVGLPFSMQRLMAALDELNDVAGDGVGQLVGDGVAGKPALLRAPEAVRLVLYEDGLQVHRLPPMTYGDASAKAVLQDIMDGFFPYCLKAEFPDGVPIRLVDRTSERRPTHVGSPGANNIRNFLDLDDTAPKQHPARLPHTVIRNGQVVEVGGDGRRHPLPASGSQLAPAGSKAGHGQVALVSTPADVLLTTSQRNHGGPSLPPPSRDGFPAASSSSHSLSHSSGVHLPPIHGTRQTPDISVLQVKSEDGRCTFILKLEYDETIASLRKYIDAHRAEMAAEQGQPAPSGGYEIRSAFPARAFNDLGETLRAAGLIPNATLFLRAAR